jgi:hypothetical protein
MIPIHKIKYRSTHQHNKICSGMNVTNLIIYLNNFLEFILLQKIGSYNGALDQCPNQITLWPSPFFRKSE